MSETKAINRSALTKWAITVFMGLILFFAIPTDGILTPQIRNYLIVSVLFIMIVAFELLPNLVSSLLLPCVYIITGVAAAEVALSPWTNVLIYMVIAALIFTNVMTDCGLLRRIALWIINHAGGSFMGLVYALFAACLVISYLSLVQAWLLMASLGVALCKTMGYKAGDKESLILMSSVLCGSLSTCVYTYNPSLCPIMEKGLQLYDPTATISVIDLAIAHAPYILLCILFLWIMGKVLKVKDIDTKKGTSYLADEYKKMGAISPEEKKSLVSLIFLLVFVMTSNWHGLAAVHGFVIAVVYLYLPGINVGKPESLSKVNITVPVFMVACMSIGTVASSIGLDTLICDKLSAMLQGSGTYPVMYAVFALGSIANFFMTPLGIIAALSDSVAKIAMNLGVSVRAALYTLDLSTDFLIFPYENAWVLVTFSLGMMKMKDFIKWQLLRSIMLLVFLGVVFIPWWMLLGII